MIDGVVSEPFSATGLLPLQQDGMGENRDKVIRVSRERYARAKEIVEDKISRWSQSIELSPPQPQRSFGGPSQGPYGAGSMGSKNKKRPPQRSFGDDRGFEQNNDRQMSDERRAPRSSDVSRSDFSRKGPSGEDRRDGVSTRSSARDDGAQRRDTRPQRNEAPAQGLQAQTHRHDTREQTERKIAPRANDQRMGNGGSKQESSHPMSLEHLMNKKPVSFSNNNQQPDKQKDHKGVEKKHPPETKETH